ncbi:MAG: hypothetical protein V3V03_03295 [Hyphomonadaceae bacterium]
MTDELRTHDRTDLHTDGLILLPNGFRIPIAIKDMSKRGAKVNLKTYMILPDKFAVQIYSPDRRKLKHCNCTRQWQRRNDAGVHFLDSRTENIS